MKILNYGAGAVGLGLDSFLLKASQDVDILTRRETAVALKKFGLRRTGIFGNFYAPPKSFACFASLKQIPKQPYDFILVSVKSFDSAFAAKDVKAHPFLFDKNTKIVLCQNGWGNAQVFAKFLPAKQIYNARIITGFERSAPNEVKVTVHADAIHLGSLFHGDLRPLESLTKALTKGGIPCVVVKDIAKDLWAKILYNCALNPLGAILNVSYGDLAKNDFTRSLMNDVIKEIYAVMKKYGYTTHWPTPEKYLKVFYTKLVPATAKHFPSMLQDIHAKKKTEIEALNGAVCTLAERKKLETPCNKALTKIIKFLEDKYLN